MLRSRFFRALYVAYMVTSLIQMTRYKPISSEIHSPTRRDYALAGRLHLSRVENMIQRHDRGIAKVMFKWEPLKPLSPLESDTNRRLLLATAKFFQSIGKFATARDSLRKCQELPSTKDRPLIVSRLADIYCELDEYGKAHAIAESEIDIMKRHRKQGRLLRRLGLSSVEADIGQGRLETAERSLEELVNVETKHRLDINDQLLRVRALMARARISHYQGQYVEALGRWRMALHDARQHASFKNGRGFTTAIIYLSIAHAQLKTGDRQGGRQSWEFAVGILRNERCDYWIPTVATKWFSRIVNEVRDLQGWPVCIMAPDDLECNHVQ